MARNRPYTTQSFEFDYPCFVACPEAWQKAEKAYIRLSILYRADTVGTLDLSKYIPREFSGYYYLIKSGAIVEYKPIEFKHQEVFFDRHIWLSENTIQSSISDLTTLDTDIDSIDELSRVVGFTGGFLLDILTNLDIPFLDLGLEAIQGLIDSIASDDLNYFPSPDRPDKLAFSIPDGLVSLSLEFGWIPYSPIMIAGGLAELSIESQIELIKPSELLGLGAISDIKTFEEIAAGKGFITTSQCSKNSALGSLQDAQSLGFSPSEILDKLLENGDILQDDIDDILANNPDFSPLDILEELIIRDKISGDDINRTLSDLSKDSVPQQQYIMIFFADSSSVALRGNSYTSVAAACPPINLRRVGLRTEYYFSGNPQKQTTNYPLITLAEGYRLSGAWLRDTGTQLRPLVTGTFLRNNISLTNSGGYVGLQTVGVIDLNLASAIVSNATVAVTSLGTSPVIVTHNTTVISDVFFATYDLGIAGYRIETNEGATYFSGAAPTASILI